MYINICAYLLLYVLIVFVICSRSERDPDISCVDQSE